MAQKYDPADSATCPAKQSTSSSSAKLEDHWKMSALKMIMYKRARAQPKPSTRGSIRIDLSCQGWPLFCRQRRTKVSLYSQTFSTSKHSWAGATCSKYATCVRHVATSPSLPLFPKELNETQTGPYYQTQFRCLASKHVFLQITHV